MLPAVGNFTNMYQAAKREWNIRTSLYNNRLHHSTLCCHILYKNIPYNNIHDATMY